MTDNERKQKHDEAEQRLIERLQQEGKAFIEPPEWIPLLPKAGTYKHPAYGDVVFDAGRNQRFADNFRAGLYQSRVPIDAEHQLKTGGALGWITDVRINPDGTADGRAEWTERGAAMLRDNRFAFVSPEFYDKWVAPDTGIEHRDILIGAGLTSKPFFKESSLRSLLSSMSESQTFVELNLEEEQQVQYTEQQYNELDQRFQTAQADAKKFAEQAQAFQAQLVKANEAIEAMQFQARVQRFSELTKDWVGDQATNIQTAELWAQNFGEDSPEFKAYVQNCTAIAAQAKQSNLFKELGSSAPANSDNVVERINGLISRKMSEAGIDRNGAMERVFSENPELYYQYSRQVQQKV